MSHQKLGEQTEVKVVEVTNIVITVLVWFHVQGEVYFTLASGNNSVVSAHPATNRPQAPSAPWLTSPFSVH